MSDQPAVKSVKPAKPAKPIGKRKPYILPPLPVNVQSVYTDATKLRAALVQLIGESAISVMHVRNFVKEFNTELKIAIAKRPGQSADPVDRKRAKLQARLAKIQAELGTLPVKST